MKRAFKQTSKQIIIGLSLLICGMIPAQEAGSYLHFNVGGGLNNLAYKIQDGTQKGQAGFTLNAAYSYFFNPQWGIQTGVGLQSFGSISTYNFLSSSPEVDTDGDSYLFKTKYTNWQEKQQALYVEIPVMAQYRHFFNQKWGLMASAGAKIALPLNAGYKSAGGDITTTGYYPQWNVELNNLPQHGFSTVTDFKGNLSLKPAVIVIAELGGLYKLSPCMDLYVGGYFNYGLNNTITPDTKTIYQKDGTYNGMFASNQVANVLPVSVGLKVGVYLQIGKKKPVIEKPVELPASQPTVQTVDTLKKEVQKDTTVAVIQTPKIVETPKDTVKIIPAVKEEVIQKVDSFIVVKTLAESISIHFDVNSDIPTGLENAKIKTISDMLKGNPSIRLYIIGHTCNIGSHAANMKVGMRRAQTMKQKFIEQGVPESQLFTQSKAYDQPLVPNTSEANRIKNRRVELKVFKITTK